MKIGLNSTTTRSAYFLLRNLQHSMAVEKTLRRMSCCTRPKDYDGRLGDTLYACVVHRFVLKLYWPATHDCCSMEVDLEHCYNIHVTMGWLPSPASRHISTLETIIGACQWEWPLARFMHASQENVVVRWILRRCLHFARN